MPRYALLLRYDGSACHGVWRRTGTVTVGSALDAAFARLGEPAAEAHPASRTDAGVHAMGQVAHVDCARTWDPALLVAALTRQLPPWLGCQSAAAVAGDWHATHTARGKTYRYVLDLAAVPDPFRRAFAWRPPHGTGLDRLREAASLLPARLDASAFARRGDHRTTFAITRLRCRWHQRDALAIAVIHGDRFTYRLVRSLVGGMVAVAHGGCSLAEWRAALAGEVTSAARQQAPAHGLWLWRIDSVPPPSWTRTAGD